MVSGLRPLQSISPQRNTKVVGKAQRLEIERIATMYILLALKRLFEIAF
jgi:hypothetical protein